MQNYNVKILVCPSSISEFETIITFDAMTILTPDFEKPTFTRCMNIVVTRASDLYFRDKDKYYTTRMIFTIILPFSTIRFPLILCPSTWFEHTNVIANHLAEYYGLSMKAQNELLY